MQFLIVTGLSGSGKTLAIHALEDNGFFCIDNIPFDLIPRFFQLCVNSKKDEKFAAVVDIRSLASFGKQSCIDRQRLDLLKKYPLKILFLEASDDVLICRYNETRRRHPLIGSQISSIADAIIAERAALCEMRNSADYVIDTTQLNPAQLKERVRKLFGDELKSSMSISIQSFGFKYGLPGDADLVFDVRCLPNPHYIDELRPQTGLDQPVKEHIFQFDDANKLFERIMELIMFSIPLFIKEGRSHLAISIGCTGGRHRSVAFAERVKGTLDCSGIIATVAHRDIAR